MAAVGLGLMTVAACGRSPAASPVSPITLNQAGYATELRQSFGQYHWPPDYRPDTDRLIEATQPLADERLSAGVTRTVLDIVNSCAWYLSWDAATARGDREASEGALRVMAGKLTRYPPAEDLRGKEFVTRAAERAKAGDPEMARQYVRANCQTVRWRGK
ncbi:hypothetical protein [Streptomyces sp. NPDC006195]|uniref:hypothetical protein n=1 Tax=unclassified Streptomyces TaxID=2593676 RepID=UPI0033BF298F